MKNLNGNYQGTCAELLLLNVVGIRVHVCLIEWAGIVRFADEGTFSSCMYECEPWEMDGKRVQKGLDREACGKKKKKKRDNEKEELKGTKMEWADRVLVCYDPTCLLFPKWAKVYVLLMRGAMRNQHRQRKAEKARRGEARRGEGGGNKKTTEDEWKEIANIIKEYERRNLPASDQLWITSRIHRSTFENMGEGLISARGSIHSLCIQNSINQGH